MDEREFARAVEDALRHLYDYPYLQTHPLAQSLLPERETQLRGRALQRVLLEAIQALRPDPTVPFQSTAWRSYRYLYLRFVQGQDPLEVARELGVSLRQSQRSHQQSLHALSSALWEACQTRTSTSPSPPSSGPGDDASDGPARNGAAGSPGSGTSPLEEELTRLAGTRGQMTTRVDEVVASALSTIQPLARKKGVTVDVSVPADLPTVRIERGLVRQALVSILATFLEKAVSSVQITVSGAEQRVEIQLAVSMAGGAEVSVARRSRASGPGDLAALGRDEGFAVGERLLAASGVALAVAPAPSGEVAVSFGLPIARVDTVLIIEDNPDAAVLFERYLTAEPYDVLVAGAGEQALRLAQGKRPSVITLDLMMPSQDGWEVLQTLKNDPRTLDIPVIVCSVLKQRDLALLLGAAEFLTKPVSRPALLEALRRCLARSRSGSPGRPGDSASAPRPRAPATE